MAGFPRNPPLIDNEHPETGETRIQNESLECLYQGTWFPAVRQHEIRAQLLHATDLYGSYIYPRPEDDNGTNRTAYLHRDRNYGEQWANLPPIIHEFYPPANKRSVKPKDVLRDARNRIMLDPYDHPIRDFPGELPIVISDKLHGVWVEYYLRSNREIRVYDLVARMGIVAKNNKPVRTARLTERATKFRKAAACSTWNDKTGSAQIRQAILNLLPPNATSTQSLGAYLSKTQLESLYKVNKGTFANRARKTAREARAVEGLAATLASQASQPPVTGPINTGASNITRTTAGKSVTPPGQNDDVHSQVGTTPRVNNKRLRAHTSLDLEWAVGEMASPPSKRPKHVLTEQQRRHPDVASLEATSQAFAPDSSEKTELSRPRHQSRPHKRSFDQLTSNDGYVTSGPSCSKRQKKLSSRGSFHDLTGFHEVARPSRSNQTSGEIRSETTASNQEASKTFADPLNLPPYAISREEIHTHGQGFIGENSFPATALLSDEFIDDTFGPRLTQQQQARQLRAAWIDLNQCEKCQSVSRKIKHQHVNVSTQNDPLDAANHHLACRSASPHHQLHTAESLLCTNPYDSSATDTSHTENVISTCRDLNHGSQFQGTAQGPYMSPTSAVSTDCDPECLKFGSDHPYFETQPSVQASTADLIDASLYRTSNSAIEFGLYDQTHESSMIQQGIDSQFNNDATSHPCFDPSSQGFQLEAKFFKHRGDFRYAEPVSPEEIATVHDRLQLTRMDFMLKTGGGHDLGNNYEHESYMAQFQRLQDQFNRMWKGPGDAPLLYGCRAEEWTNGFASWLVVDEQGLNLLEYVRLNEGIQ